ncbi:PREDICTED: uncharacterized protein LOC104742540 [Camelina sativa]|uniref:Uncharacterized protein LOC104742540 n=1 Tax=Camelina sativa TaxID=90675 RepID=A0ABM0VVX5_CAMSA|nr:PREDICTED: uncharacterized protein LOC104742540 [Camelina sativa]
MDPCPFVRITVGNLAVRFPRSSSSSSSSSSSGPSVSDVSSGNCYCKIKFKRFPRKIFTVPVLLRTESESESESRCCFSGNVSTVAACFSLSKSQIEASLKKPKWSVLSVEVYSRGVASCRFVAAASGDKLIGRFEVPLDLKAAETKTCLAHNGWVDLGTKSKKKKKKSGSDPELHVSVRVEPDRRFVFQFDGEPECSPQVFQVQGNTKQAVFTCKFGFRNPADRRSLSTSLSSLSLSSGKERLMKERKGWSITIHDLSGSPVAMASMVTPFVPSPGSNRVSPSSPGAWLILRPDGYTWKPWGRLQAWREQGTSDVLGYRFELFQDGVAIPVSASSSINTRLGGSFIIDGSTTCTTASLTGSGESFDLTSRSSMESSRTGSGSSGSDFGFSLPQGQQKLGFVMSTTVEGAEKQSRPKVEVGVKHVTCTEDAAAHVALAAAVDLSMDACRLFSRKLRKELRQLSRVAVV